QRLTTGRHEFLGNENLDGFRRHRPDFKPGFAVRIATEQMDVGKALKKPLPQYLTKLLRRVGGRAISCLDRVERPRQVLPVLRQFANRWQQMRGLLAAGFLIKAHAVWLKLRSFGRQFVAHAVPRSVSDSTISSEPKLV